MTDKHKELTDSFLNYLSKMSLEKNGEKYPTIPVDMYIDSDSFEEYEKRGIWLYGSVPNNKKKIKKIV